MRILKWLLVILMAISIPLPGKAQESDSQELSAIQENNQAKQLISLSGELQNLEKIYDANIFYKSSEVQNKYVAKVNGKRQDLQTSLENLLKRIDMEYRKLTPTSFVVFEKEEVKKIQQETISGTVTDAQSGETLPGVNILVKGTSTGASTDADGNFELTVESLQDTLVFSFIGYQTQEVPINGRKEIDVKMTSQTITGEEMVVVGYGTQTERSVTNSISTVSSEQISKHSTGDMRQTLQGTVPGLTIVDQGGRPGEETINMYLRGVTSVNNSSPLVIVDGVEASLQEVDPNSVESVSVLKDAASTAIYGSRGANGIILITTKKGKQGLSVTYDGSVGLQKPTILPEFMDTESFMRIQNVIFENSDDPTWTHYSEEEIQNYLSKMESAPYENPPVHYSWDDVLVNNAAKSNHSLTLSGGTDIIQSMVNFFYSGREGQYPNRDSNKYQLRSNNNINILGDIITARTNLYLERSDEHTPGSGILPEYFTVQGNVTKGTPFAGRLYNQDGSYYTGARFNPHFLSDPEYQGMQNTTNDLASIDVGVDVEPIEGLLFESSYFVRYGQDLFTSNTPKYIYYNNLPGQETNIWNQNQRNSLQEDRSRFLRTIFKQVISYDGSFKNHNINGLVGYSEDVFKTEGISQYAQDFYNNDIRDFSQSTIESRNINNSSTEWGLRSLFSRLQYNFSNRYLLELSARWDGSSRFPKGRKYSFFPSGSVGWRLSEESFWTPIESFIEDFKIRYSYGITGNQNVGPYSYIPQLQVTNPYIFADESGSEELVTGVVQNSLASSELSWETTTQHNIGIDLSTLSGRLGINFDVFSKVTDNILLNVPVPAVVGLDPSNTNAGQIRNKGWELRTSWRDNIKEFQYQIQLGVSNVIDKLTDFGGLERTFLQNGGKNAYGREQGSPVYAIFGYEALGYFQTQEEVDNSAVWGNRDDVVPGDVKYKDINGDGVINPDGDYKVIGDVTPKNTFSLNLNLSWKNIDLSTFWQGVSGVQRALGGYRAEHGIYGNSSVLKLVKGNYWQESGDSDVRFPRPQIKASKNLRPSTHWLLDASYLRLKSLRLGYAIPAFLTERISIKRLQIYLRGTNLLTFSGLKKWGIDPEGVPIGHDGYRGNPNHSLRMIFPSQVRSYNIGVRLEF